MAAAVAEKVKSMASILAVGTANPPNCIYQADYPDYYFRVTNCDHMKEFKEKFRRLCEKSGIQKRFMYLTEDILRENPSLCTHRSPSLDIRQKISEDEVPKLGKEAALKAIQEWGQPKSKITHLIFCSIQAVHMPGADYHLTKLLGLEPSVKRVMLYHQGCYVSATALRMAKDFAENNRGARVLVVCCDMTVGSFRGPDENDIDNLSMQAIFADGAAAVIVGADVGTSSFFEQPLFRIVSASQAIIPNSDDALSGYVKENGFTMKSKRKNPGLVASLISGYMEEFLTGLFHAIGINTITDWNLVFWVTQATANPVLDRIEASLKLEKEKMEASRKVMREYGYLMSASTLFVLDEVKKRSLVKRKEKMGEGSEYGVLIGFGAGLTIEAVVIQSINMDFDTSGTTRCGL